MTQDPAAAHDRVDLAWAGELHGALMLDRHTLHHVVWDPAAPTPTGLPVVRLPAVPAFRYHDIAGLNRRYRLHRQIGFDIHVPVRRLGRRAYDGGFDRHHQVRLLDLARGRAFLFVPGEDVRYREGWGQYCSVHFAWLDLTSGAITPIGTLRSSWPVPDFEFVLQPDGMVVMSGAREASPALPGLISGDVDERRSAFGTDFLAQAPVGAVERWSLDGNVRRSRVDDLVIAGIRHHLAAVQVHLGYYAREIAVDAADRIWACGNWGLIVLDAADRLVLALTHGEFGEPANMPLFRGVDHQGRAWFEEKGYFTCFRLWELEPGLRAPILARADDRSGLEPTL